MSGASSRKLLRWSMLCLAGCSLDMSGLLGGAGLDASGVRTSKSDSGVVRRRDASSGSRAEGGSKSKEGGAAAREAGLADHASAADGSSKDSGPPVVSPAYYVAPNGNDSNVGSLAAPFATFARAQTAMQGSNVKVTYVRAGTYAPAVTGTNCVWGNAAGSAVTLASADEGETWSYYPPDGVGSAVLDGQSTTGTWGATGGNGAGCGFGLNGASAVTIAGLAFQNFQYAAVWGANAPSAVVEDNVVHDITSAAKSTGAVYLDSSPGAVVKGNYIHDVAYSGVEIEDSSDLGNAIGGTTVASNVVIDACTWPSGSSGGAHEDGGDCGAIYFWSQTVSTSTGMSVAGNYVRDVNAASNGAGDFGSCCTLGVFLDDGIDNVTVSGNVVTGVTSSCFLIHGGQDNTLLGNLCDLGARGGEAIVEYQEDGDTQMTGNVFEHNLVVAAGSGSGGGFSGVNAPPTPMTIQDNGYWNYVGSAVDTAGVGGAGSDSAPTYANPKLSCWAPVIASGSGVLGPPVSFPQIAGGWGPPGFQMPMTGTAPSWPHGC